MKKIAILTINDYQNYGNRLQNYATQEVLKTLGFSVETIVNSTMLKKQNNKNKIIDRINNLRRMTTKERYRRITSMLLKYLYKRKIENNKAKRIESFKNFTKNCILETKYTISVDNIPDTLATKFDYFITGSDQVWNPFIKQGTSIYFLTFAQKIKRIAYSPSFGVSEIPSKYIENYKVWLSEMSKLSVRENSGSAIIRKLTGRDAIVLIDPTLMLTKEKWISISKRASNKPKKEFLLKYILGTSSHDYKRIIKKIAKENDLKIVNLADIKDKENYKVDPSEFIDYINSASIVCTDSFHACIFSILMETPLIVFDRIGTLSMNSRIDTLLSTFKLESRLLKNIKTNEQIFNVDYSHVASILEFERNKAINYLKEALN